jgi:hypothetical protein
VAQTIIHKLRCWPEPFEAAWRGDRTAEYREDDRNFQVGDILFEQEWTPTDRGQPHGDGWFTGRVIRFVVTHVSREGPCGVPKGYVVLSVKRLFEGPPQFDPATLQTIL